MIFHMVISPRTGWMLKFLKLFRDSNFGSGSVFISFVQEITFLVVRTCEGGESYFLLTFVVKCSVLWGIMTICSVVACVFISLLNGRIISSFVFQFVPSVQLV